MKIGFAGLGKMGKNMALALMRNGIEVVGYNRSSEVTKMLINKGIIPSYSLEELVCKLGTNRKIVWVMVSEGKPVKEVLFNEKTGLINFLEKGDIVVDGGNSFYEDSIENAGKLSEKGIVMLDCGTSGGPKGALNGLSLMIGGSKTAYSELKELWESLAVEGGYGHVGGSGAGHFVKMVHNAIEYGFMEALGEGFGLLKEYNEKLDLEKIANIWSNGSVIESKLVRLAALALSDESSISELDAYIDDNKEVRWALKEAITKEIPMTAIAYSLFARYDSRGRDAFGKKLIAALRKEFGGHSVRKR
ncbi:decarboxylating 6-phosphogluconate dehydrogenase [Candidatus Dojkabacteria bacterium]|nr:decarboxylating 6-phosphogluconate dehydrogenase [Candidatus Dojkabacteria bacterium]